MRYQALDPAQRLGQCEQPEAAQKQRDFFFGGIDLFFTDQFRAGVEGRGNGAGWGVTTSLSWRF